MQPMMCFSDFLNHNFEKHLRDRYSSPILSSIWTSSWSEAHGLVLSGEGTLNSYCLVGVLSLDKVSFLKRSNVCLKFEYAL